MHHPPLVTDALEYPAMNDDGRGGGVDSRLDLLEWLGALGRLNDELNHFEDIATFLDRIAETAALMFGCDFALLLVADADGTLRKAGAHGLDPDYLSSFRPFRPDERNDMWTPILEAIDSGQPVQVPDIDAEPRLRYWQPMGHRQGFRSFTSVPLISRAGCRGVLNVYNRMTRTFDALELALLRSIAGYAAAAVETATLHQERAQRLSQLTELLRQRELADDVHTLLTRTVLDRQGVIGIARALGQVLTAAVVIEDFGQRILAAVSQDEGRADVRALIRTARAVKPPSIGDVDSRRPSTLVNGEREDGRVLYAAPVVLDQRIVGTLWALVPAELDGSLVRRAIEHGTMAVALDMLGHKVQEQSRAQTDAQLLSDLLGAAGRSSAELVMETADRLGYDLRSPQLALLAGDPDGVADGETLQSAIEAVRSGLGDRACQPFTARHGNVVAVLLPAGENFVLSPDQAAAAMRKALDPHPRTAAWPVVMAGMCQDLAAIRDNLALGENLLRLARRSRRPGTILDARRLGVYRLLVETSDVERLRALREEVLGSLLAYDERHGSSLVDTLECYLANDLRAKVTAKELMIHINTLTYRLGRIQEILGVEIKSPSNLVTLQLGLTIHRVLG
ncbi:GAF domain-containing protein [Thermopolyspora sp. NPDC052614]|uniref:helix-turn-helix domain-containing protein n=1 Tax=Thermopolyspora sp. NPDC052614 TaxID=3155682 RepID=UPI003416B91F